MMGLDTLLKDVSPLLMRLLLLLFTTACVVDINISDLTVSFEWTWKGTLCLVAVTIAYISSWVMEKWNRISDKGAKGPQFKKGPGYLTATQEAKVDKLIADSVVYDASQVPCVARFNKMQKKSECLFAKRAKVWGSPEINLSMSLEENVFRMIPTFYKFTLTFQDLGLDAFVMELPGKEYGSNIETFSEAVKQILVTLRQADIKRTRHHLLSDTSGKLTPVDIENRMRYLGPEDTSKWDRPSWVFEFSKITFFITTFAPFYPETNSRFSHDMKDCYILFQPEISFAVHELPPDTAVTKWDNPETVRDKIRVAFRDAGREYLPPMVTRWPMVYEIVKPVDPSHCVVEWWKGSLLKGEKNVEQ